MTNSLCVPFPFCFREFFANTFYFIFDSKTTRGVKLYNNKNNTLNKKITVHISTELCFYKIDSHLIQWRTGQSVRLLDGK